MGIRNKMHWRGFVVLHPHFAARISWRIRSYLAILLWLAATGPNSLAAPRYWDVNGPALGAGVAPSGTWDTGGFKNNWSASADGTGAEVAWVDGSDAVFAAGNDATGNYSITILGNPSLPSLTVEEGTVSITGTLNFGATAGAPIDVASGASYSQGGSGSVFAGTGGLTKTGAGTLFLRGTNTFTRSGTGSQAFLTISGGVVDFLTDLNLGALPSATDNTGALTINGGTLRYVGSTAYTWANRRGITIGASGGTIEVPTALTLTMPNTSPTTTIGGAGTLTKSGGGRLSLLSTLSTFAGKYIITAGSLSFQTDSVFGPVPASAQADYFTLNGGALRVGVTSHATLNANRGITLGASGGALIGPIEGMTYAGVIAGTQGGKLTIALQDSVTDPSTFGSVNLNGPNTYDGPTQIETGMTLRTTMIANGSVSSGIGSSSSSAGNLIINGGKLSYFGSVAASTDRNFTITAAGGTVENISTQSLTFTSTDAIAMSGTGSRTLTLNGGSTNVNNTMSLAITNAGASPTSLTKSSSGNWVLSNPNNSYTGNTTISGGRLKLGAAGVVPDASLVSMTGSTSVFDLNGFNEMVKSISGTIGTIALGGNTLSLATPSGETFSGIITGAGGSVVKAGSGMQTLGGANTYSGNTVIQSGTLRITNPYLADAADVLITSGAILNLSFSSTDVVDSLIVDGVPQAIGIWGPVGSGAAHESALFAGTGRLQVTSSIPGDFNGDGKVDAGDFATWRKNDGTNNSLPNDSGLGTPVGAAHYQLWRSNFASGAGAGAGVGATAVPETSTIAILAIGVIILSWHRRWFRVL